MRIFRRRWAGLLALMAAVAASPGLAAPEGGCPGLVAFGAPRILPAALAANEVELTFVGHATFLIETSGGVTIATDYNDYVRPSIVPQVVTMNRAHSTHYSNRPDPGIRTILPGWNRDGGAAPRHDLTLGDVRIRNVLTNIREWGGDSTILDGNSIFIFEVADLCIAHLGHLHHTLRPEHLAQIGRPDIVLVPVDGSYTLDLDGMMEVIRSLSPRLMIPMHFFGSATLDRFLDRAAASGFAVQRRDNPRMVAARDSLPPTPTVLVLPGR